MPAFAAQYQFAAAFIVFLVALAGFALVLLRGEPIASSHSTRLALGTGFLAIAAASFLRGSLLLEASDALLGLRAIGVAGVVAGSLNWRGSPMSRWWLWSGSGALLLALPFELGDRLSLAGTTISALGGVLLGLALLNASRRVIAARVAASAAGTLLLIVLVLSVALSTVLATTVEDQALADLDDRALSEAAAIEAQNRVLVKDATVVASLLVRLQRNPADLNSPRLLSQLGTEGQATPEQQDAITAELERARREIYNDTAFAYISESLRVVARAGADDDVIGAVARSEVVGDAMRTSPHVGGAGTVVIAGDAYNVAVAPIGLRLAQGDNPFGAVIAVFPLDDRYLAQRVEAGGSDALALVNEEGPIARAGELPQPEAVRRIAVDVLGRASRSDLVTDELVAAARPVRVAERQRPVLALVAARSTEGIDDVRRNLFQTFFIIAFGGTVLSLLLAALVGDRIGSGIRRLTASAESIQLGALGVRSGVRSEDEVGVLGATFDSMAESIEQQTGELQAAAARVEAIVAGMGEALVAVDDSGRITDFNAAAEELLGRSATAARGLPVEAVMNLMRDDGSDLTPRLRVADAERWSALADLVVPSGDKVPVALTAGALRGVDGHVEGAVIVLRDLRGEREVERMKRHFLSRVGHELRTPLTPLIGYSQMLAGRDLPPERARAVYGSILSSAKRLERIVEMLEFFASLDAGRQVLRPEPVDVRDVITGVVDRWDQASGERHTLSKRISRETPQVMVDGRWLGRAVDELVDNAIKFSPSGGRVTVTAGLAEEAPGMVEIAVRDQGVGMSPEQVESAFAEWTQGDESDTRSYGGLGLGLALVQRVAEHHGGRVTCTTSPGKGATFSILLPAMAGEGGVVSQRRPRRPRRNTADTGESSGSNGRRSPSDGGRAT